MGADRGPQHLQRNGTLCDGAPPPASSSPLLVLRESPSFYCWKRWKTVLSLHTLSGDAQGLTAPQANGDGPPASHGHCIPAPELSAPSHGSNWVGAVARRACPAQCRASRYVPAAGGTAVLRLLGRAGRRRRSRLAAGSVLGWGHISTSIRAGRAKGSAVLSARGRRCSRCPHLNLLHFLSMPALSLGENSSSAQAPGCTGQE